MAYNDEAVKAKLAALNETQDSIVSVAQWIMFHRRHADRTASLWLQRLQENPSTSKRLNLIYLANEVVQQSRARSKQDFLLAFEPLIADATTSTYKGASQDVQGKLRRVVEVWRQRQIFDPRIQEQTEQRLAEIDKQKSGKSIGGGGGRLGGSLFGGSGSGVAPELEHLNKIRTTLSKAEASNKAPVNTANAEYAKMTDPATIKPSAPVRAAKLRGLEKDLMAAQKAMESTIKARKDLIAGLERLLESNRAKIADEEGTNSQLCEKVEEVGNTIKEVEDSIMRGQDGVPTDDDVNGDSWSLPEPERPETEGFTPPPDIESFTPPSQQDVNDFTMDRGNEDSTLPADQGFASTTGAEPIEELPPNHNEIPPSYIPPPAIPQQNAAIQAEDFLKNLMSQSQIRPASSELQTSVHGSSPGDPRLKRRKMSHNASNSMDDEIFGANNVGGVDEDSISAMLGQ